MEAIAGILCSLLVVLTIVTLLGHGIWVTIAALFRLISPPVPERATAPKSSLKMGTAVVEPGPFSSGPPERISASKPPASTWREDMQATYRQLERLRNQDLIGPRENTALVERLREFERLMRSRQAETYRSSPDVPPVSDAAIGVPAPVEPTRAIPPEPAASPSEVFDAIVIDSEPPQREAIRPRPLHPLDRDYADSPRPPSLPRRTLADVFQSFMAEKNIRWGELVSGLLIVGSAVGLVISLRATLSDTIPYFPALIFLLITLAIYGAGMYTLRRWNLQATSRGMLIIALLLSPLNFVAAIVLSGPDQRPVTDPWYLGAVGLGLLVCGGITFSGGRALVGAGWWRLTTAVLATSLGQLVVDRQTAVPLTAGGTSLLLALPLAGYLVAVVTQILRAAAWPRLSARRAQQIFIVLGIATFSFLPPVALFLSHAQAWREAVASLSPVLSIVAVAILASGLLVHRRTEARALAGLRTSGTALAVAGAMLMISALVLAWPRPELLIVVGLVNFVALTVLAILGQLPVLHVPAVGCAALSGLIGFHVWQANLVWGGDPVSQHVTRWLSAGRSGLVLLVLSVLVAVAAAVWNRWGRRAESLAYLASVGGLSGLSLLVAFWAGFGPGSDISLATPIFAFYAIAAFTAVCVLTRQPTGDPEFELGLTWAAIVLWFVALLHALWQNEFCIAWLSEWLIEPDRPWTMALVAHSLCASLAALVLALPDFRVAVPQRWGRIWQSVIPALTQGCLLSSLIGALLVPATELAFVPLADFAFVPAAVYLACASVAWLVAAAIYRQPVVWTIFQALASLAVVCAVVGWDRQWWPIRDVAGLVHVLQAEAVVLGLWCMAWSLVRRAVRDQAVVHAVLRAGWPPVDQWLLGALVPVAVGLGVAAAWQGLAWEISGSVSGAILATTGLTWIAVAIVAAALIVSLADRTTLEALFGLLLCGAAAMLLLATLAPMEATASAWRWWSAGYALATAVMIWLREPMHARLQRVEWLAPWTFPSTTAAAVRETALFLGAGPVLAVTTAIAIRSSAQLAVGAVPVDSFFHRMGTTASYAVPLVVLVAVLLGHALRERRPAFAVAGSVILQYVVSLAFLLQASPSEPDFMAGLLQWNLVALGGYSLVWLALARRIRPADQRDGDVLLGGQIYATVALLGVLGIWAALSIVLTPGEFAPRGQPLGQPLSFVGWLAACTAAVWYAWSRQQRTVASLLRPAVACGWLLVALIAAAVDPSDIVRHWLAYHVLTCGGLLLTAVLSIAWWRHPALVWDAAVSGGLVFLLGVRGGWADPHPWAPWWSVTACGAVAVQWALFSLRGRRQGWAYASVLAGVAATTIYWLGPFQGRWQRDGAQAVFELIVADLVVVLAAAAVWLAAEIWWQRRGGSIGLDERFRGARMHVVGSLVVLVWLSLLFYGAAPINAVDAARQAVPPVDLVAGGGWLAALLLLAVLAGALWDDRSRHGIPGLYFGGLMLAALMIDRVGLELPQLLVTALVTAAVYVMLTGWAWRRGGLLATFGAGLGIREPVAGLQRTEGWLPGVSLLFAFGTSLIALTVVSLFEDRSLRYAAAAVPALSAVGVGALSQPQRRAAMQVIALLMTGLATIYLGWADLTPRWDERDLLLRMFRLLMALSVLTFVYGVLLPRWLGKLHTWQTSVRQTAATFGFAGVASLLGVLALEWVVFQAGGEPIAAAQVVAVAVVLVALIAGLIALALQTGGALSTWSETQRMGCVLAAELVAALLFVHIYLCRPEWFAGFLLPYWPYIVMAIAFVGVTVGHLCQRSGLKVLSEPLVGTGAFLPLLPALGYWMLVAEGTNYSLLLFTVGLMYVLLSILRHSAASAAAAVIAGNGALWALLRDQGFSVWQQPQFWLIPPAVSVLIAGQLNRHRLTDEQLTALRYASVLVIYVSSTSEMFLRGIGSSLWPPMVLASLSVAGVMLGIALRVRAFLYLGTSFVLLSVISMVWHAAKAIQHSWPWWAFGIGLGIAILAMFAVFEKKRPEILRWSESMRQWEQ